MAHYSYYNETSTPHAPFNPDHLTHPLYHEFMGQLPRQYDAISSTHNHWLEGSSPFSPAFRSSHSSPTSNVGDYQEGMHLVDPSPTSWNQQGAWNPDVYGPTFLHDGDTYGVSYYPTEDLYPLQANGHRALGLNPQLPPVSSHPDATSKVPTRPFPVAIAPELFQLPVAYADVNARSAHPTKLYEQGSDLDVEGETDKEDDGDEEYMALSPPTFTQPRSHRTTCSVSVTSSSHYSHSRCTPPKSPRVSQPTIQLARAVPSSRESHSGDPKPSFHTLCDTIPTRFTRRQEPGTGLPNYNSTNDTGDFCCETCHRVFPRARRPDFERHVDVHYPELARGGPLLCCGLPVEQVNNYHESDVMVFYDRRMVGGCGKLFSRTDALKRHLESARRGCVGDLSGDWHPPKQRK